MFGMNTSSAEVFIPFSVAAKLQSPEFFFMINTLIVSPEAAEEAESEVRFTLRKMRGLEPDEPDTFGVAAIDQFIDQFKALAAGITAIAGGIVGISLLVGGIGIMNIMLVSVTERTREIGIRLAIGALAREVRLQFLTEAVVLCALGGLVGLILAFIASFSLAGLIDVPFVFDPTINILSFLFASGMGIVFGYYPARRASQLDPIDALRHE